MSHGSATMEEYLDGLPPFLLKTAKPLASKSDWVPGVHVIRGGLDFTAGKLPHYKDLQYEFVPFSETGNSRFDDDKTTYLASSDGTVTVWARPTEESRTKRKVQTLTLDGWEYHHVLLLRLQNTIAKHSTRMFVVSPTRSQQIPALSHNLRINAQPNGVNHTAESATGGMDNATYDELLRLRAENSALRTDKQDLQEKLAQALLQSKELQKLVTSNQTHLDEVEEERRHSEADLRMQIEDLTEAKQALLKRIEGMSERLEIQQAEAADGATHLTVKDKDMSACKSRSLSMQDFMTQEQMLGEAESTMAKVQTITPAGPEAAELADVRAQLEAKASACDDMQAQLKTLREQLDKAVRENQDAHTGMEVLQEQLAQSKATIAEFELDHADVAHKLSEEETKAAALKQEHEQTQTGIEVLQEQLAESKASIVDFEMEHAKRIDELTAEVAEKTRQQKALEEELAAVAKTDGLESVTDPAQLEELEQLRHDKEAAIKDLESLTETLEAVKATKDDLEQKLKDAQLGMELMQDELAQSKATISEFEMEHETNLAKLSAEVDEQTRSSSAAQDELSSTKAKLDEAVRKLSGTPSSGDDSAVQALHAEIASLTTAAQNSEGKADSLASELASKNELVSSLEAAVAALKAENGAREEAVQTLEAQLAPLEAENTASATRIAELEAQIQAASASTAALEAAEATVADLREQIEESTASLQAQTDELAALRASGKESESTVIALQSTIDGLKGDNKTQKVLVDEITAQLDVKTTAVESLEAELKELKASDSEQGETTEKLRAELALAVAAKEALEAEKQKLDTDIASKEEELDASAQQVNKLIERGIATAATIEALQGDVDTLKKEAESLQATCTEQTATIAQLQAEAQQISSQDASATEAQAALQKKIDEQSVELEDSAAQINKLIEKSVTQANTIAEVSADKDTVELERDDLNTQVADLTEQVATLRSQLETAQAHASSAPVELPETLDDASLETALQALHAKVAKMETVAPPTPAPESLSDDQAEKAIDAHLAKGIADVLQRLAQCERAIASQGGATLVGDNDEPAEVDDEPAEVDDEPAEVDEEPTDIDDEPSDMGEEPSDIGDEPAEDEPSDLGEDPDEEEDDFF